jgi:hypothetical protein
MKKYCLLLILTILPILCFSQKEKIVLGNETFSYILSTEGNRIVPVSYFDIVQEKELLNNIDTKPYFEFILNGQLITSAMPLWTYKGNNKRNMANGGIETVSTFAGHGAATGIILMLDHQYFPGSNLIRERMRLKANGKSAQLNNLNGRNHFVFPCYNLNTSVSKIDIQEIRMGSYNMEILDDFSPERTYDNRSARNLAGCHMFHTDFIAHNTDNGNVEVKGPFTVMAINDYKIVTSYEHASQDYALSGSKNGNSTAIDLSQGVKASMDYVPTDDDYWFIGTVFEKNLNTVSVSQKIHRGGYLDGEQIPQNGYYETVWSTINFIPADEDHLATIKHYILNQITEHKLSRETYFYYNTWGMQRDTGNEGEDMRETFNEKRILDEIDYAAELNIDFIVLDDGWQETMGIWTPNQRKLPNGLNALIERMRKYGIKPGLWLSLMGIDSTTIRYNQHRDWVILDAKGSPIAAQWDHPAFDLVGGFYDMIKEDHKYLINLGFKFFKWDAINTFNSTHPKLGKGAVGYSRKERIDRYNYLLPFYVVKLMRELREYDPEVVIEIDLTEPERAMIGLMPLQEGKLFWMNNGASGYGDYSTFRSKSMRNIINQTGSLLPPEVLTYAYYPHNTAPHFAQRYNINSTLIAGHGVWGNLKIMGSNDRAKAGSLIKKSKRIMPYINGIPLLIKGLIGASPEIYAQIDKDTAYGQIVAFSGQAIEHKYHAEVNTENFLGVLNHAFHAESNRLVFDFQFTMPDDTREAFILGNDGKGIQIVSYTGWLDDIQLENKSLNIKTGSAGIMKIRLPEELKNIRLNCEYTLVDGIMKIFAKAGQQITINWI